MAFVSDFETRNFNLKTKLNMENKTSKNHETGNDANRLLAAAYSFRQLEWDYYTPPKISSSFRKIVAQHKFELPKFINEERECTIDICEVDYTLTGLVYEATIWWFNRGIKIVHSSEGIKSFDECQKLVNERMFEFSTVFLGCC